MKIHRTAVVEEGAVVREGVEVGAFAYIQAGAEIGPRCVIGPATHILSGSVLGEGVITHSHCVIGDLPQDLRFDRNIKSGVVVGANSEFREGVTIHRSTHAGENTKIGTNCYFMANSHVAHDCVVENNVILVNGSLLAGHVHVGDKVFFGGNAAIHQFCRVGRLAMIGGLSRVGSDVPPFMLLELDSTIRNINIVGLKRAGFTRAQIDGVKHAYMLLYHRGLPFRMAYERIENEVGTPEALEIVQFCRGTKRGISRHFGSAEAVEPEAKQ